ncbi:MAG: hypothetical protein JXA42_03605 [Anaerolineales bacterium]|nr:hypothetical protein [Anaerolineales bacterium]
MKGIKRFAVIVAFVASLVLPSLQLAVGTSLADLDISPAPVWACENPQPFGGC